MTEPSRYVSPDARRAVPDPAGQRKPWMSEPDAHFRCWRCGHRDEDLTALAEHEDGCRGTQS